jgi:hypothetical protein
MTTRRQFIKIVPLAGAAFVVGCSDKAAEAPKVVAAAPAPVVAPVAVPVVNEPAVTPAPAATTAPPSAANTSTSTMALVDEKDPTAVALGYVSNATKADTTKYKTYAAGQHCGACQLFQGQANAAIGPCTLFAGKQVNGQGWCSAFAKKAA